MGAWKWFCHNALDITVLWRRMTRNGAAGNVALAQEVHRRLEAAAMTTGCSAPLKGGLAGLLQGEYRGLLP